MVTIDRLEAFLANASLIDNIDSSQFEIFNPFDDFFLSISAAITFIVPFFYNFPLRLLFDLKDIAVFLVWRTKPLSSSTVP